MFRPVVLIGRRVPKRTGKGALRWLFEIASIENNLVETINQYDSNLL